MRDWTSKARTPNRTGSRRHRREFFAAHAGRSRRVAACGCGGDLARARCSSILARRSGNIAPRRIHGGGAGVAAGLPFGVDVPAPWASAVCVSTVVAGGGAGRFMPGGGGSAGGGWQHEAGNWVARSGRRGGLVAGGIMSFAGHHTGVGVEAYVGVCGGGFQISFAGATGRVRSRARGRGWGCPVRMFGLGVFSSRAGIRWVR